MKRLLCAVVLLGARGLAEGWVVIPVTEYEALRGKADPRPPKPDAAPVDATLTRVDYDLHVAAALVSGRANLTVDVLKEGWVRVPIPAGLLVREARLSGQLVSLAATPGKSGQFSAVLSKKGRSVLMLDVAFAITSAGGEERLTLPAARSGVTRASISRETSKADPQELDVKVTGGFLTEKSAAHWLAYGRGNEALVFTWRRRVEERRSELPLRMRGSLTQLFGLGEDSSALNAEVQLEIVQGAASQVRIAVPDTITINQVPGATVADWDVKGGELVVNFLEPMEQSAKFAITGEIRLAREGSLAIPLLRLIGFERESGGVAVEVLGAGEIKDTRQQGLDPAEAADLGAMVAGRQSPSLAAFRLRAGAPSRSLSVDVARYAQQAMLTANVEEARFHALLTAEGKTLVLARYAVRNNQRNFVRVTLPAGATLWSAALGGRPIRPGLAADGGLLFPLEKNRAGEETPLFALEIVYLARGAAWGPKGRATLTLPALDLPVSHTGLVLYYPPQFRVTPEPAAFRTQSYEKPATEVLEAHAPGAIEAPANPSVPQSAAQNATQALLDRYKSRPESRRAAALPIQVSFPAVGPSLFLVSELTGEGKSATIDLNYQKEKKGGTK
jgi:hypothetical protein